MSGHHAPTAPPQRAGDSVKMYVGGKLVEVPNRSSNSTQAASSATAGGTTRVLETITKDAATPTTTAATDQSRHDQHHSVEIGCWQLIDMQLADVPRNVGDVVRLEVGGRDVSLVRVLACKLIELDRQFVEVNSVAPHHSLPSRRFNAPSAQTPPQRSGGCGLALIDSVCYHAGGPLCHGKVSLVTPLEDIEDLRTSSVDEQHQTSFSISSRTSTSSGSDAANEIVDRSAASSLIDRLKGMAVGEVVAGNNQTKGSSRELVCLVCPWHRYTIDVRSGAGLYRDTSTGDWKWKERGLEKQRVHDVAVVDGRLWARLTGRGDPSLIIAQDSVCASTPTGSRAVAPRQETALSGPEFVESDRYAYMRLFEYQG